MPTPVRRVKRRDVSYDIGLATPTKDRSPTATVRDLGEAPATPTPKRNLRRLADADIPDTPQSKHARVAPEQAIICRAKALFQRGSSTRDVVGRDLERASLKAFLFKHIGSQTNGAMYVSGLPGTGKSALVTEVVDELSGTYQTTINCMTVEHAYHIFSLIAKQYGYIDRRSAMKPEEASELLDAKFSDRSCSHVLVLDELDHIVTRDQDVIFKLFEWACGDSNLILIGIANAIDLTDRFLPRLQAHQLLPDLLPFKPYSSQGIIDIIESRLKSLDPELSPRYPLMLPAAVRLCAVKTAANSGDLRMAFDICRRSIELIAEEEYVQPDADLEDIPKVSVSHVARVCGAAFEVKNTTARIKDLTFQQKAVLCVLMVVERKSSAKAKFTVFDVFQDYENKAANNPAMTSLQYKEFLQVVTALEAAGLIVLMGICKKRGLATRQRVGSSTVGSSHSRLSGEGLQDDTGNRRIVSRAQLMDVITGLADILPLRQMLMGGL